MAVDTHHTLKFYEFINKAEKEREEEEAKQHEEMRKTWKEMLIKYDKDNSGKITADEFLELMNDYWKTAYPESGY